MTLLDGFVSNTTDVNGIAVHHAVRGDGPPVLLLHGYPQTHVMWHRVAPSLAENHTVVLADLRGYGDSARPPGGVDHGGYAKRAMAADQVGLMRALGFERFAVVGHDRGARVAHRMCRDHPDAVTAAAVLDILPTLYLYENVDRELATAYFHWFFLSQPAELPEQLVGADPEAFLRAALHRWGREPDAFDERAVAEYVRWFTSPGAVHASCEDYRAAASIDLDHDRADRDVAVRCPLLVSWGARGFVGTHYDVESVWREHATDVTVAPLDCGHFVAEERPAETVAMLRDFLAAAASRS